MYNLRIKFAIYVNSSAVKLIKLAKYNRIFASVPFKTARYHAKGTDEPIDSHRVTHRGKNSQNTRTGTHTIAKMMILKSTIQFTIKSAFFLKTFYSIKSAAIRSKFNRIHCDIEANYHKVCIDESNERNGTKPQRQRQSVKCESKQKKLTKKIKSLGQSDAGRRGYVVEAPPPPLETAVNERKFA